jgi:hypothetical protein
MSLALVFVELGESLGVFLTRSRYEFLNKFERAKASAGNWHEFLGWFNAEELSYLQSFMEPDEVQPLPGQPLLDQINDVFVLGDAEFPLPQLASETHEELLMLPAWRVDAEWVLVTEFGSPIGIFSVAVVPEAESMLGVRIERLSTSRELRNYG